MVLYCNLYSESLLNREYRPAPNACLGYPSNALVLNHAAEKLHNAMWRQDLESTTFEALALANIL